jgi:hypothetical protein
MLEVMVGFVGLLANGAIVGRGETGCFEHAAGSEGISENGGKVIMKLVGGLCVVGWESSSDVLEDWAVWFFVE